MALQLSDSTTETVNMCFCSLTTLIMVTETKTRPVGHTLDLLKEDQKEKLLEFKTETSLENSEQTKPV